MLSTSLYRHVLRPLPSSVTTTVTSDQHWCADVRLEKKLRLDCGMGTVPWSIADPGIGSDVERSPFAETAILSSEIRVPCSRFGSCRTHLANRVLHLHRQHASDQRQLRKAARHGVLLHSRASAIAFSCPPLERTRESYIRKKILAPLFLLTYPSAASAALLSMASDSESIQPQISRK